MAGSKGVHSWRHGWIPLTATAAKSKNHGREPKPGSEVAKTADNAIRAKAGKMSPTDHVKAATQAINAGDHATAINHLTAAMGKTSGSEREALKAHRDKLADRAMHGSPKRAPAKPDLSTEAGRRAAVAGVDLSTPKGRALVRAAQKASEERASPSPAAKKANAKLIRGR